MSESKDHAVFARSSAKACWSALTDALARWPAAWWGLALVIRLVTGVGTSSLPLRSANHSRELYAFGLDMPIRLPQDVRQNAVVACLQLWPTGHCSPKAPASWLSWA